MRTAVLASMVAGAWLVVAPRAARADTLGAPADTLDAPADTLGAHADTLDADSCAAHAESAQRERLAGHIEIARDELAECSKAECPDVVRRDCERWFIETEARTAAEIATTPGPPRPSEPAGPPTDPSGPTVGSVVGWSLVGVGAVSVGLGLYFGVRTFSSPCAGSGVCTADERDSASTAGALSGAGFIGGLVLVTGGLIVLLSR